MIYPSAANFTDLAKIEFKALFRFNSVKQTVWLFQPRLQDYDARQ